MSQTVSMTFLVSSKVFATSRTSFLRLLGIGEVWILPWIFENSRISKRNTSIDGSRSVETRRDRKCQWSSRNVTVIIFVFLFFCFCLQLTSRNISWILLTFVSRLQTRVPRFISGVSRSRTRFSDHNSPFILGHDLSTCGGEKNPRAVCWFFPTQHKQLKTSVYKIIARSGAWPQSASIVRYFQFKN